MVPRLMLPAAVVFGLSLASSGFAQSTPAFTAAQAKRGAEFYSGSCALCHGDRLDDGEFGPALKGQPHTDYWRGKNAADVLTYMNSMMPPTSPGSLGGQAYADIMAYMLQAEGAPAGDKELPSDPVALRSAAPTP